MIPTLSKGDVPPNVIPLSISVCLFVCLSVYLFVCLSVCLCVCLFVCPAYFPARQAKAKSFYYMIVKLSMINLYVNLEANPDMALDF